MDVAKCNEILETLGEEDAAYVAFGMTPPLRDGFGLQTLLSVLARKGDTPEVLLKKKIVDLNGDGPNAPRMRAFGERSPEIAAIADQLANVLPVLETDFRLLQVPYLVERHGIVLFDKPIPVRPSSICLYISNAVADVLGDVIQLPEGKRATESMTRTPLLIGSADELSKVCLEFAHRIIEKIETLWDSYKTSKQDQDQKISQIIIEEIVKLSGHARAFSVSSGADYYKASLHIAAAYSLLRPDSKMTQESIYKGGLRINMYSVTFEEFQRDVAQILARYL